MTTGIGSVPSGNNGHYADNDDMTPTILSRSHSAPTLRTQALGQTQSVRHHVTFSERRFDIKTLPADLQRVYHQLSERFGEEYGLIFCFTVRTAVELHRAWHMTLLTSKILQQLKDRFDMRMTWELGVIHLKFRVEDGGFELHRKVPYDYDAEFQDLYMKIAVAFIEGNINIHQALIFQTETKLGKHTAKSGLFLRKHPGRLILYPLEAATCAVIFFGGDWTDGGVAAVCGLATGLVDMSLQKYASADTQILVDAAVGFVTGIVGGLFYQYTGESNCLSAIFLGTLYWFFYGTAFVIGILEIVAGELQTGVTRFIAVSVKTFVLTLGSVIGLQLIVSENAFDAWNAQTGPEVCNTIDLKEMWWRTPLYLLCSASALGQYRTPIVSYWRGLVVQLVGYEIQFQMFTYFAARHDRDFLDTAISNIVAAAASVLVACTMSYVLDNLGFYYSARLLQRDRGEKFSTLGECAYRFAAAAVRFHHRLGIGRESSYEALMLLQDKLPRSTAELADPNHPRQEIRLTPEEEAVLVEAIVDAENLNNWSLLMPTVYQLVPGSLIALLWYNAVFPPPLIETRRIIPALNVTYIDFSSNPRGDDVFYGLFVISTSLALGLLLGFAIVSEVSPRLRFIFSRFAWCQPPSDRTEEEKKREEERVERLRFRQQGITNVVATDDPSDDQLSRTGMTRDGIGLDRVGAIRRENEVSSLSAVQEKES